MLKVGITGGIGSGKTTVCKIFETLGVPVYSADDRAKELMQTNPELIADVISIFGKEAYIDGQLNRSLISSKVFNNKPLLAKLNAVVHPAVGKDAENWMAQHSTEPYILKEAALLFETGSYKKLDKVIVVFAPVDERVKRLKARDSATYEEITARMKNQLSDDEKIKLADFIIYNDGSKPLIEQVMMLHKVLMALSGKRVVD